MSFGHVGSVATIYNYEQADTYFNKTPEHKRCKGWMSHERCLKKRASGNRHYRIEQHDGGEYYDVCLYQKVMGRFYRPDANGHCRVLYAGHHTTTSQSFMWNVLGTWRSQSRNTSDGRLVVAPVYNNNTIIDKADSFSADLTFDSERRLVVEKSKHSPHYVYRSSDEDKAKRKRIKEKFSTYTTLALLRMPEFAENCCPTQDKGRPFGGGDTSYNERMAVESLWEGGCEVEQHWVDHFFDMCQEVYDVLVSKRGYEQANFHLGYRYYSASSQQVSTPADLEKPITEKDFEKAILAKVIQLVGANGGTMAVEQPPFMSKEDYPRSTITPYA